MKNKLLIADDDSINLIAMQVFFENDYDLFFANNGHEVIEILEKQTVDLIILDWKMPIMNGLETLKFIKSHIKYKDIPTIIVTGVMTSKDDLISAYELGAIDYVKKPIKIDELKFKIYSIINLLNSTKDKLRIKSEALSKSELVNFNYNNILEKIKENIDDLFSKNEPIILKEEILKIKTNLENHFKMNSKVDLIKNYKEINNDFVKILVKKHPNITNTEIKLCILIRLNIDTKEIANISFQTYDSVRVARTRLRKKLNLSKKETLIGYLMQF